VKLVLGNDLQDDFLAVHADKTILPKPTQLHIKTSQDQFYTLMISDAHAFVIINFRASTLANEDYLTLSTEMFAYIPKKVMSICGATETEFSKTSQINPISYLGRGIKNSTKIIFPENKKISQMSYAALLVALENSSQNSTFENCLIENFNQEIKNLLQTNSDIYSNMQIASGVAFFILLLGVCYYVYCANENEIKQVNQFNGIPDEPFVPAHNIIVDDNDFSEKKSQPHSVNETRLKKIGIKDHLIPDRFKCAIFFNVMDKPVQTVGSLPVHPKYEKSAIEQWFNNYDYAPHNPSETLRDKSVISDGKLKKQIRNFVLKHELIFAKKQERKMEYQKRMLRGRAK